MLDRLVVSDLIDFIRYEMLDIDAGPVLIPVLHTVAHLSEERATVTRWYG